MLKPKSSGRKKRKKQIKQTKNPTLRVGTYQPFFKDKDYDNPMVHKTPPSHAEVIVNHSEGSWEDYLLVTPAGEVNL